MAPREGAFVTGDAHNATVGNGPLAPGMEMIAKPFTLDTRAFKIRAMIKDQAA